jgi:hypothetical protein
LTIGYDGNDPKKYPKISVLAELKKLDKGGNWVCFEDYLKLMLRSSFLSAGCKMEMKF